MKKLNTKTITLTGSEQEIRISGQNCDIRNDGVDTVYAAGEPNITAGADGVMSIPAGHAVKLLGVEGTLYLLGSGTVQICGNDYSELVFKTAATSSGEGGVDQDARNAIGAHTGNAEIHVTAEERDAWNAKAERPDIPTVLPADGGNADTVDGKHASEFVNISATVAADANNAPEGLSSIDGNAFNNPFGFWATLLTLGSNNSAYKQQYAFPWAAGEASIMPKYRVCDAGVWHDWQECNDKMRSYILSIGADILSYAENDSCPRDCNTLVRAVNSASCPVNYGYIADNNDFQYLIYKLDNDYISIKAYDVRSNAEFINNKHNGVWSGWVRSNDGGNADTVDGLHSDHFIGSGEFVYNAINSGDADSLTTDGHYFVFNTTNVPYTYCMLDVIRGDGSGFSPNGAKDIITQIAYDFDTNSVSRRRSNNNGEEWTGWSSLADNGNAATLNGHSDVDFVLKSEYDALVARVAALENGTS